MDTDSGIPGGAGWFAINGTRQGDGRKCPGLVPEDAIYVITTPDPIKGWKDISGSKMWTHLRTNTYHKTDRIYRSPR